jgi:hypothetical protein
MTYNIVIVYMSISSSYTFNSGHRIGTDATYNTQQNIQNASYEKYNLANYHSDNLSQDTVYFAAHNPSVIINQSHRGHGLGGKTIDIESKLHIRAERERSFEKIDLQQRVFATIPYLGRGAGNTAVETKLQWGDWVPKRHPTKELSHADYSICANDKMKKIMINSEHITDQRVGVNSRYD